MRHSNVASVTEAQYKGKKQKGKWNFPGTRSLTASVQNKILGKASELCVCLKLLLKGSDEITVKE